MAIVALLASASAEAWACPNCATARAVRAWAIGESPIVRLFLVLLPLLVLAIIVGGLERIGRTPLPEERP